MEIVLPDKETLSSGSALTRTFRPASKNWPESQQKAN